MHLKVIEAGHPILRQHARALGPSELRTPAVQQLIALLRDTMRDEPGVGLAAPQVGERVRLVVVEDRPEYTAGAPPERLAELERTPVPFQALVNPRLTVEDATPVEAFEGCLSVPGYTALVVRARAVRLEAQDGDGAPVDLVARGWYARILQHEIDHLDGILYTDRMVPRSLISDRVYDRFWRGRPLGEIKAGLGIE